MTGSKQIKPYIQDLFREHGGRVSVNEGVEYLIKHVDPFVIAEIERSALRNSVRDAFRQFGEAGERVDGLPGVLNVGDGEYVLRTISTVDERVDAISKYSTRVAANAKVRDNLAEETLREFGHLPGVTARVEAARLGESMVTA